MYKSILIYFLKQIKKKIWLLGVGAVVGTQNFLKGKLLNNKLFGTIESSYYYCLSQYSIYFCQ